MYSSKIKHVHVYYTVKTEVTNKTTATIFLQTIKMKNIFKNGSVWPLTYDLATCLHKNKIYFKAGS
jgi:hypothetical protein